MKRLLLLIAFFVGLIPNLKDMCLESAYCAKGQSGYEELNQGGISHYPKCELCDARLEEGFINDKRIQFCPYCDSFCERCGTVFRKDQEGTHTCPANNDDSSENGNNPSNPTNPSYRYKCLTCLTILYTEQQKKDHIARYNHYSYEKIK